MILTKNEIPPNFRSKLKERLNEAIDNLDNIIKMSAEEIPASSELEIGSFVSVTEPKYLNRKGRIWFIKNDIACVNLDGNKNYVNINCRNLTNLSVSGESKREQLIWFYENQIKEIREILYDSKVPDILLSNEYNIVQIPTQSPGHGSVCHEERKLIVLFNVV